MIDFYGLWKLFIESGVSESSFIDDFLSKTHTSTYPLLNSDVEVAKDIFAFFLTRNIDCFVDKVSYFDNLEAADVPQFSSLEAALVSIPLTLENAEVNMSFKDIGQKMISTKNDLARMKYGENHSKMSFECSFVEIVKRGTKSSVKLTSLGKASTYFNKDDIFKVSAFFFLRNRLIQNILYKALRGKADYYYEVRFLSQATARRRESNVKKLIEVLLNYSDRSELIDNIVW